MDIENLLSRLQRAGLTQTQIADAIGCTQPTISEMASGKVGKIRPSWRIVEGLIKLAEKHGLRATQAESSSRRRSTDKRTPE